MPFTLSHAAAVLPALRRRGDARGSLVACALIAGSFAPDATYFLDSLVTGAMAFGAFTHSLPGLLTVDVLITGVLVGLWLLVREPVVALLPPAWQPRWGSLVRGEHWRRRPPLLLAAWFSLSSVLGSLSHAGWDAFTHPHRWGTEAFPSLMRPLAGLPTYTYVQYGSSAVALGVLTWFTVRALRATETGPATAPLLGRRQRRWVLVALAGCAVAGAVHRCARWYGYVGEIETPLDILPTACFGAGAGLTTGVLLYAMAVRIGRRKSGDRPSRKGSVPVPSQ
ncbi:DUF4184 family protein [Streptomyces sp. NPDC006879]|uniref:DUF4184 family protein n=1 Tax=Streptomyces sp. NPDC006879 TaxID=3364767 RepID=UPI0036C31CD7